jgi:Na+/H+-translocating membrane pyrophosphatase
LVSLALFGAYVTRVAAIESSAYTVNVLEPFTFAGLLFGAMIPYLFSSLTISAVGSAAEEMIVEIRDQVPRIKRGEQGYPNYDRCIAISTTASLKKMIAPGVLVIFTPIITGILFGYKCLSGLLAGIITSGI